MCEQQTDDTPSSRPSSLRISVFLMEVAASAVVCHHHQQQQRLCRSIHGRHHVVSEDLFHRGPEQCTQGAPAGRTIKREKEEEGHHSGDFDCKSDFFPLKTAGPPGCQHVAAPS